MPLYDGARRLYAQAQAPAAAEVNSNRKRKRRGHLLHDDTNPATAAASWAKQRPDTDKAAGALHTSQPKPTHGEETAVSVDRLNELQRARVKVKCRSYIQSCVPRSRG